MTELSQAQRNLLRQARSEMSPSSEQTKALRSKISSALQASHLGGEPNDAGHEQSLVSASPSASAAVGVAGKGGALVVASAGVKLAAVAAVFAGLGFSAGFFVGQSQSPALPLAAPVDQRGLEQEGDAPVFRGGESPQVAAPSPELPENASVPSRGAASAGAASVPSSPFIPPDGTPQRERPPSAHVKAQRSRLEKTQQATGPSTAKSLHRELGLLQKAQQASRRRDWKLARSLLDELQRKFPDSSLAEERQAAAVLVACGESASSPASRQAADEFLESFPASAYAGRLREACAPGSSGKRVLHDDSEEDLP